MKRKLLIFFMSFLLAPAVWALETEDHFTISDVTVSPGGAYAYFDVSLVGSRLYTAYNLDIHFPVGLSVYYNNGAPAVSMLQTEDIYPYTEDMEHNKTYSHSLSCSYGEAGERTLRIACISTQSAEFTANSGKLFRVYIVASSFLKPSTASLSFDGQNLTTKGETKYVPADKSYTVNVASTSTVPVSISATNKYGTCVLPFDAELPDGLEAYSCSTYQDANLLLEPVASLSAYVPYILYAANGFNGNLSGTVSGTNYTDVATAGYLCGAVEPQQISTGYVLQNQGDGVKFHLISGSTIAIPEGHCWVNIPTSSRAYFEISRGTTGINPISVDSTDDAYYSLDGKRIPEPKTKSIYISNGKKIMK